MIFKNISLLSLTLTELNIIMCRGWRLKFFRLVLKISRQISITRKFKTPFEPFVKDQIILHNFLTLVGFFRKDEHWINLMLVFKLISSKFLKIPPKEELTVAYMVIFIAIFFKWRGGQYQTIFLCIKSMFLWKLMNFNILCPLYLG